ncbi:MAG: PAS domain S-box protein [Verrucomicrobia bacterium]|nr:PAS domain S-box protein [Verrucomicrobiota bacterium]
MKTDLRQRAEDLLDANPETTPVLSTAEVQRVVHELQVHQIELEMQNEELRQAHVELAQSRDTYAGLYDFAPVGYVTLDRDGAMVEANHTAATLFGVARGSLLRRKLADFVARDAQDDWFRCRREILADGEKRTVELAFRSDDNAPFIARLDIIPLPGAPSEPWRAMVSLIDISSQKSAEEALREAHDNQERLVEQRTAELHKSERRFKALTEFLPQPIWETDLGGDFTYTNRAGHELLGYSRQDLEAGVHIADVIAPEDRERIQKALLKLIQGEEVTDHEYTCSRKDGSTFPVVIYSTLIMTDGKPSGVRGITLDITERRQAEARLRRLASKLATAQDDERRRIAEGLHDDVAQLLTACSVMLGVASKMDDATKRNAIVDDIDGFLSEAGEKVRSLSFELASATLYRLGLREALEELCGTMNERYNTQFSITEGEPLENLDESTATALLKAARELLFNVVRHAGSPKARASLVQGRDCLLLTVEDSGQGFPSQGDDGQPYVGQGLGLFSIEERLRELGGDMQIQSTPGEGARVTLRVPMGKRQTSEEADA